MVIIIQVSLPSYELSICIIRITSPKIRRISKKVWDGINTLLVRKKKNSSNKINIIENDKFITDQYDVANKFNIFFTNIGHKCTEYLLQPNINSFFLAPTTPDEIASELRSLPESIASVMCQSKL